VDYASSMVDAAQEIARIANEGDVILTLGAGSISQAGAIVLEELAR